MKKSFILIILTVIFIISGLYFINLSEPLTIPAYPLTSDVIDYAQLKYGFSYDIEAIDMIGEDIQAYSLKEAGYEYQIYAYLKSEFGFA